MEKASEYLADYELCVHRVKVQLKRDLVAQEENNARCHSCSGSQDLFIHMKKSFFLIWREVGEKNREDILLINGHPLTHSPLQIN